MKDIITEELERKQANLFKLKRQVEKSLKNVRNIEGNGFLHGHRQMKSM